MNKSTPAFPDIEPKAWTYVPKLRLNWIESALTIIYIRYRNKFL